MAVAKKTGVQKPSVHKQQSLKAMLGLLSVEMMLTLILFIGALFGLAYLIRKVIVLHQNSFDERMSAFL